MEKCSDVMTKNPVFGLRDVSVVVAARLMKSKGIGAIPVIENELTKELMGIVTDRDLTLAIVAEGRNPQTIKLEDVMTRDVITCYADDDLQTALDVMSEYQLRRIPVVDHENRLLGIIAQADIATRIDQPKKTAELVKEISQEYHPI